jgi:hypothetical protein
MSVAGWQQQQQQQAQEYPITSVGPDLVANFVHWCWETTGGYW